MFQHGGFPKRTEDWAGTAIRHLEAGRDALAGVQLGTSGQKSTFALPSASGPDFSPMPPFRLGMGHRRRAKPALVTAHDFAGEKFWYPRL